MKLHEETDIRQMARELGLGKHRNAEVAIREFCIERIERIMRPFAEIDNFDLFLEAVSSGLGIKFEEIQDDFDLSELVRKYASQGEIIFAELPRQLDDNTDAVLIRLSNIKQWKYIAVIDCRNHKRWKAYFSKWHEIAHVLTMSPQAAFQFRRTLAVKKDPEEQMVDRVAGDLAFYSPLFLPDLLARIKIHKKLTFDIIDDLRMSKCPKASREATIRAAISRAPIPVLMVIADYAMKKQEERLIKSCQGNLFPVVGDMFPKLRAVDVVVNEKADKIGLRIHRNMEIPSGSIINETYDDVTSSDTSFFNIENLDWWKHSRGQLGLMAIQVEARKIGQRVTALINPV